MSFLDGNKISDRAGKTAKHRCRKYSSDGNEKDAEDFLRFHVIKTKSRKRQEEQGFEIMQPARQKKRNSKTEGKGMPQKQEGLVFRFRNPPYFF
ncbi:MAG: hypothetical protein IKH30_20345 [Clostridia bacterium]|nr:hypothetical protein [Clostridia bacterium]